MYLEYCNYNVNTLHTKTENERVFRLIDQNVDGLATSLSFFRQIKEYLPKELKTSVPIAYPLGTQESKIKEHETVLACKSGASYIDVVYNRQLIIDEKYKEFVEEFKTLIKICDNYGVIPRVMLDYRHYELKQMTELCKLFVNIGLQCVFPCINYHNDDFMDNCIAAAYISKRVDIQTIFNGYVWLQEQVDIVMESGIYGFRFFNPKIMDWCIPK